MRDRYEWWVDGWLQGVRFFLLFPSNSTTASSPCRCFFLRHPLFLSLSTPSAPGISSLPLFSFLTVSAGVTETATTFSTTHLAATRSFVRQLEVASHTECNARANGKRTSIKFVAFVRSLVRSVERAMGL